MAVGDDIPVRRDDDTAADAVFDGLLKMLVGHLPEESLELGGKSLHGPVGGVNLI
jgi:hypothetical protein